MSASALWYCGGCAVVQWGDVGGAWGYGGLWGNMGTWGVMGQYGDMGFMGQYGDMGGHGGLWGHGRMWGLGAIWGVVGGHGGSWGHGDTGTWHTGWHCSVGWKEEMKHVGGRGTQGRGCIAVPWGHGGALPSHNATGRGHCHPIMPGEGRCHPMMPRGGTAIP